MASERQRGALYKRGETWWCWYIADGVRYFESTKTADKRVAGSVLADRKRNGPPAEKVALTLDAWLDQWLERREKAGVRIVSDERQWLRDYVRPTLGKRELATITRVDLRDLVAALTQGEIVSVKTGERLAARSTLHVYRTLATAFSDAVLDGKLTATPCTLKTRKGELPRKKDADPEWRSSAVYSRAEAERLLTDARIPADRRAFYALMLLAGLRSSEACGRRWMDYEPAAVPLGRLVVATQAAGMAELRETKTADRRTVPVVPALAGILDTWRREGFPQLFGRHPQPSDPIVPTRSDPTGRSFRQATMMHQRIQEDRERIGLRAVPHAQHAQRATFLSLLESSGANMAIARRATHAAPSDVVGGYIRTSWEDLCREVAKLPIDLSPGAKVIQLVPKAANGYTICDSQPDATESTVNQASGAWAHLDSNQDTPRYERGALTG